MSYKQIGIQVWEAQVKVIIQVKDLNVKSLNLNLKHLEFKYFSGPFTAIVICFLAHLLGFTFQLVCIVSTKSS